MGNLREAIEELTEAIGKSNSFDLTSWIMIAITFIYVVTTVFICVANLRSAKATRDQLAEQKRQFDETNRAVVEVTVDTIQGAWLGFIFKNTGLKLARDICVSINDAFLEELEGEGKKLIPELLKSSFILGIGQAYTVAFCNLGEQTSLCNAIVNVSYRDDKEEYSDEFTFNLSLDNWRLIDTSDLSQIREHLKVIVKYLNEKKTD